MKQLLTLSILFTFIGSYGQNNITKHLEYGKYDIGYKVIHTYDNSRSFFPKYGYYGDRTDYPIGRPIQISVWFPANKNHESSPVLFGDYIGFTASEIDFSKNNQEERKALSDAFINSLENKAKQRQLRDLLNSSTHSYFNAKKLNGDFPIVLYAPPMNTSAIDNSIICEYLASKGYVVLATMAKGEYAQLQQRSIRAAVVQANDLGFLLHYAQKEYESDKIGVFGYSLGGLANIIFAARNKAVDATICLDGSIMSQGWLSDFMTSDLYAPETFTSNLFFIGKNLKAPDQNPSTFLDEVKYADKALMRYDIEQHSHFSGLYLLIDMINNETLTDSQQETNYLFFAEMTEYIGRFFDQYLNGLNAFKVQLSKSHDFSFSFERGNKTPPDPNAIGQLIIDKGIHHVRTIVDSTLVYEEEYLKSLDWRSLMQVANTFSRENRIDEAIQTLHLANRVLPNMYSIHRNLGDLYLQKSDTNYAEKHYRIALGDNPRDFESIEALTQMKKKVPDYHDIKIEDVSPYLGKYIVDDKRHRNVYRQEGELFLASNYWTEPVKLWPYKADLFLVESDDVRHNMQILFHFNELGKIDSMSIRGLNSGRINNPNPKE